jgi:hypothetical protein
MFCIFKVQIRRYASDPGVGRGVAPVPPSAAGSPAAAVVAGTGLGLGTGLTAGRNVMAGRTLMVDL